MAALLLILFLLLLLLEVIQQDALVAALVGLVRGVDAAAGLNAGRGAEVQHHVVVWLAAVEPVGVLVQEVLVVEGVVGELVARRGAGVAVQPSGPQAAASDAHPSHGVKAQVVPGVDLGQELSSQVLGQRPELGVQDIVVQLFGQQFTVQVDVGAVPASKQTKEWIR